MNSNLKVKNSELKNKKGVNKLFSEEEGNISSKIHESRSNNSISLNFQVEKKKSIFDKFNQKNEDPYYNFLKVNTEKNIKKKNFLEKMKYYIMLGAFYLQKNFVFLIIVNICIFYALFADYLRIMIFRQSFDIFFDIFLCLCILIFILELIVYLITEKKYLLSFYFTLDIITIVFLVFDITSLADKIFYSTDEITFLSQIALELSKIVRIIRLIRVLKFFKTKNFDRNSKKNSKVTDKQSKEKIVLKESKITKILKNLNIKRMIILILIMLIIIPFFNVEIWTNNTKEMKLLYKASILLPTFVEYPQNKSANLDNLKSRFEENSLKLIKVEINSITDYEDSNELSKLRKSEKFYYKNEITYNSKNYKIILIYSQRKKIFIQALLDFINMIFISFLLIISIKSLNHNFSLLILNPLERMILKIKKVSENPLRALKHNYSENNEKEMNETLVIEKAINKISELLILGFGQAGCKIITHFLFDPDKDFDQIIPGEKIYAIFGFCDIRNFTDATEILLEDVMVFVNKIAEIVHTSVDLYGGAANKNIGDAFLLVWKLIEKKEKSKIEDKKEFEKIKKNKINQQISELSLISFIDIVIKINTDKEMLKYRKNPKLNEKMPNYKIKMGFGLHVGWAIEGAIGSRFKIDASYLSPNVNMASRLEAATKQFNKLILFTGDLFEMFVTPNLIKSTRHIDTITVKGSVKPVKLFTVDLNVNKLKVQRNDLDFEGRNTFNRIEIKNEKDFLKDERFLKKNGKSFEIEKQSVLMKMREFKTFEKDEEMIERKIRKNNFRNIFDFENENFQKFKGYFKFGLNFYLNGNWEKAKLFLDKSILLVDDDGPCMIIYNFMKEHGFKAPENWKGYRCLVDK